MIRRGHGSFTDLAALDATGAFDGTVSSAISLMNLATVRELADKMGNAEFDIRRLRANIYFDSDLPWEEINWVGRHVRVGTAIGKVMMAIPRCMVTAVNPDSGRRDLGVLPALVKNYRSKDLGVYLDVVEPGHVRPGDRIEVVDDHEETHELVQVAFRGMNLTLQVRKNQSEVAPR